MRDFDSEGKEFLFKVIRWGLGGRPRRGDKVNMLGWEMSCAELCGEPEQPSQPAGSQEVLSRVGRAGCTVQADSRRFGQSLSVRMWE